MRLKGLFSMQLKKSSLGRRDEIFGRTELRTLLEYLNLTIGCPGGG